MSATPARGLLLVRPVDTAEHLPGGRIVLTADTREKLTANQVEVVAVGAFALCDPAASRETRKCQRSHVVLAGLRLHAHPVRAGDWVVIAPRTTIEGPDPEHKEWYVHQDSVLGIFNASES